MTIGYESLRQSVARVRVGRGLIAVTGEDRKRLLHAMSTNHVESLQPGQANHAFFLNAQGRILADAWIVNRGDDLLLDTEPSTKDKLLAHLDKYIIADDVTLEDVSQTPVFALEGPSATGEGFPISAIGGTARRIYGAEPAAWQQYPEATAQDLELVRLENGRPVYGIDILDTHLVQETGQMDSVSFNKGCYLGQEIVERVRSRGAVHRHLRPLRIAGSTPPAPMTELVAGESKVGFITSSAYSERLGEVVALGMVKDALAKTGLQLADGTQVMLGERP